ncbi:MarR family winged helix-turn-helix transcriptional regulator [Thermodesulfobacteriota bacterium]
MGELLYEKSNVSKIVKKLKSQNLINVVPAPNDKRMTLLNATGKGKDIWSRCTEKFHVWNMNWIQPLSKKEIDHAIKIQERLIELSKEH